MNLLLINYEYPPLGGGAGNATMFIARALARLGHRTVVLTAAGPLAPQGRIEDHGATVVRLAVRRKAVERASLMEMLSFVIAAWRAAPALAREFSIEGAIVFFSLPCGPVALRLHRALGVPYVVSLRGGDVPGLATEIDGLHRLLAPARRRVLRSALAVVANDAGLARQSERADPYGVRVIPNGVDSGMFVPRARSRAGGGPTTVLFVGRFHQQKNLPFLLEQVARLHEAAPHDWRLVMVGDGPERSAVEHAIQRLGLRDITTLHGWQDDKLKLIALYHQADVLVNPSVYEGMPNVVLEAMACGLPVVASRIPGNDSLVIPGETGALFAPGDGDALCNALQSLRDNPTRARAQGDAGRRRAEATFSWDQVARDYALLFGQRAGPRHDPPLERK